MDIDELAAQAAYAAFLQEVRAWLPHDGSPWDELPMPLRQAWTAAARAARESGQTSTLPPFNPPLFAKPAKNGAPKDGAPAKPEN